MGFVLLLASLGLAGLAHMVSHLASQGQGLRASNAWLAVLTGSALPEAFDAGDALVSCNGWMRLISGMLFALELAWMALPCLDRSTADAAAQIEAEFIFRRAGVHL